ncbi:agmatinase [Pseudaminobacter arsenicus]|uniref:Agmatinase n=1 Tax=Borborobacter arsenicus TaxID=1851146 RepID=A0A432VB79_9HYPH|nr:arginase family protein [Pseudaminobacter arsenicus]RUM99420.1 agmatinase [Pseudaminobacter arsenicus]
MTSSSHIPADELYGSPPTFMGVPFSTDATGAKAAILGCPFDCGTHKFRIGARQGPAAIRAQSGLVRRYQSEIADCDAIAELGVIDAGDVVLTPSRAEEAFPLIEEAAYRIAAAGAVPVGFGGDGSVSLPLIRAVARVHPGVAVLHVDSHTDAYPIDPVHRYDASTQFTHAALEQRVLATASWHVGLRGSTTRAGVYGHTKELGYNIMSMTELQKMGIEEAVGALRQSLEGRPVYLSWDMDVFDPSCAPGVCTPVWGGLSAREGLDLIRMLEGLNIVGADINTVSPPHDVGEMTAFLAAAVTYEILLLIWRAQRDGGAT